MTYKYTPSIYIMTPPYVGEYNPQPEVVKRIDDRTFQTSSGKKYHRNFDHPPELIPGRLVSIRNLDGAIEEIIELGKHLQYIDERLYLFDLEHANLVYDLKNGDIATLDDLIERVDKFKKIQKEFKRFVYRKR